MQLTIDSQTRSENTNPRALRRSGKIPATLYGHKGDKSTAIAIDTKDAITMLRHATINNTVIELNVVGEDFKGITLLREVQYHPYKNDIYHLSFFSIAAQEKVEVVVPLHFVGTPAGVKEGGTVEVSLNKIRVACKPTSIPDRLNMDISHLKGGQGIRISDIPLPEGVELATDGAPRVLNVVAGRKK